MCLPVWTLSGNNHRTLRQKASSTRNRQESMTSNRKSNPLPRFPHTQARNRTENGMSPSRHQISSRLRVPLTALISQGHLLSYVIIGLDDTVESEEELFESPHTGITYAIAIKSVKTFLNVFMMSVFLCREIRQAGIYSQKYMVKPFYILLHQLSQQTDFQQ